MSGFTKVRERQQALTNDAAGFDTTLLCRMPGCRNRWTVDISHGRVCSMHDEALSRHGREKPIQRPAASLAAIPFRKAVRPYVEPSDADREDLA